MGKINFRTDINGLRAIAVMAVVLFHFNVTGFSGGFVGVDVFFVISGFLMTGIIVNGLENTAVRKFKIIDFYMARAKRIIPALFFLCLTLLIVGWVFLAPDDYVKLAREADRALLFISNNYYYKNSGYFDADSHERMLLHTWSLSVEWQFYIFYPLVLVGLSKLSLRKLPVWIAILLIASFAWSVYKTYSDQNYAFYLLPARAWEMLLGGLVFYALRSTVLDRYKTGLFYLGVLLIVVAVFYYDKNSRWPGSAALLPTIGTALVIFSAQNNLIFSNTVAQKLGNWSYSIYLWHWPLVVVLALVGIDGFTWLSGVLIVVSIVLGWLSFCFIEKPVQSFFSKKKNWITFTTVLIALSVVLLPAEKIRKSKGYIERISNDVFQVLNAEFDRFHDMDKCHDKREKKNQDCVYGEGQVSAIVMGDSHAMSLMPLVVDIYNKNNMSVLDWTGSGCPTLQGVKFSDGTGQECNKFFDKVFSGLSEYKNTPIYLSNRYSASLIGANEKNAITQPNLYFDTIHTAFDDEYTKEIYSNYIDSVCTLAENNPVYMFRPIPELIKHVPKTMGRSMLYKGESTRVSVTREYYEVRNTWANRLVDELAQRCGVVPVDVADAFCDDQHCYGDIDGQPVYFDDDHLNTKGAFLLRDALLKQINATKDLRSDS